VHDLGLVLVEDKATEREPFRELRLDLLGLLPGMAAGDQVIGLCRLRDYADRDVNVLARPLGVAAGAA
jgi:hypothetical protein